MFKAFYSRWEKRKRYSKYSDMPDELVAFFAITGFIVSGYFGYAVAQVWPDYMNAANTVPLSDWGWKGWMLTAVMLSLSLVIWHFGTVAWRCNGILRDRWYS